MLVGKFPIFGSDAKLGELADTTGKVISSNFPAFYTSNKLAYSKGLQDVNTKTLNGVLNFITSGLSEIYTRGIPEFTLNIAYPKGAVVSFNGDLFISNSDDNTTHVSQRSHWNKIKVETQCNRSKRIDDMPLGTILTVPMTTKREGYIDYVEGATFNQTLYPELYKVLGTNKFSITNRDNGNNDLPIGSCLHLLSSSPNVPDGFIEWLPYTSLVQYPELKRELEIMAQRIADTDTKTVWLQSLNQNRLPPYQDFYFGVGEVGSMKEDSIRRTDLVTAPVVIDNSNTLSPMGVTRCVAEQNTYPVVANQDTYKGYTESKYLVVGQHAEQYKADVNKNVYAVAIGQGDVTRPRTLFTRVLIKAVNPKPSAISSTHKQIIKAME